jgi:hypothetical protein
MLKEERALGESKFKTKAKVTGEPAKRQLDRFKYTFSQVADEAKDYGLVSEDDEVFRITEDGKALVESFGSQGFRFEILQRMEDKFGAFRYLLNQMFGSDVASNGVLLFPLYSPLDLGILKKDIVCGNDVMDYGNKLKNQIESDVYKLLDTRLELPNANLSIIPRLKDAGKLPKSDSEPFERNQYTAIISRYRKFWFSHLLQSVYGIRLSESTFEVWVYRGKQLGTINVTEQYPGMSGRIVYPVAVVSGSSDRDDFQKAFCYDDDNCLWLHEPSPQNFLGTFVDSLTEAYFGQRRSARSYFTSLYVVREIVCMKCKISEKRFEILLNESYEKSLASELKIKISLEVDRVPSETSATYLRREPILVRSNPYNIIAIDLGAKIKNE